MSIPVKSSTMTKAEVCEFLGKSKRTLDTYMAAGRLPVRYFHGPNGRQSAFDRKAVELFKAELDTPMVRAVPDKPGARNGIGGAWRDQLVPMGDTPIERAVAKNDAWEGMPAKLAGLAQLAADWNEKHAPLAVYISLKDAVKLTGLSAATIKGLGVEVKTRAYGNGVRYRRADLEKL